MNVPALGGSDCVLAVFSVSAQLLRSMSGALQLVWDGRDDPPRASGRWYGLWGRCWQPGLTVCLLASCNAQQRSVRPRLGPVWRSPDNHPSPNSSCTAHNAAELGLQLCHGPPLGDVVLCCVGNMSLTQPASQSSSFLCTTDKNAPCRTVSDEYEEFDTLKHMRYICKSNSKSKYFNFYFQCIWPKVYFAVTYFIIYHYKYIFLSHNVSVVQSAA